MRNTARCGNREHIGVAVILTCEGDHASVRREDGRRFDSDSNGQSCCVAAFAVDAPKIAGVVEHNLRLT